MKKFRQELEYQLISFLAWAMIHLIGLTCRLRVTGYERVQELVRSGRGFIMAVWHGRTLLPVHYCRGMGIWAITSLSRDGELQTRIVSRFGYRIIRGSTGRGGIKAALAAVKKLQESGILAITPDGPKGPPNKVQEGIVFLAQRARCPIIPIGVGARPRRLMRSWDSYALPMPFARCALAFGEPIDLAESAVGNRSPEDVIKAALDDVQRQAQLAVEEG
ncbi:MAG TPA: lysophospholipid acyltransferase family protein [Armatimonadota bacterium]|nr:lysophospholipid acyltransferase family protein [Armatimonadota bacterium]